MDLHPDFRDLLSALVDSNAEYLVVGRWAVGHHAEPRFAKDLDVFIGPSDENLVAAANALSGFGAPPNLIDTLRTLGRLTPSTKSVSRAGNTWRVGERCSVMRPDVRACEHPAHALHPSEQRRKCMLGPLAFTPVSDPLVASTAPATRFVPRAGNTFYSKTGAGSKSRPTSRRAAR